MGMAASQARFLGITARKTNTEYEGQQVNQQRTALANQSANLFNQLLGLNVPTPPSKSDSKYTKTVYAFTDDTGATATITSVVNNPDSATSLDWPKVVKYTTSTSVNKSYRSSLETNASISSKENTSTEEHNYYNYIKVSSNDNAKISRIQLAEDDDITARNNIYKNIYDSTTGTEAEKLEAAKAGVKNLYKYSATGGAKNYLSLPTDFEEDESGTGTAKTYSYSADGTKGAEVTVTRTKDAEGNYVYKVGDEDLTSILSSSGKIDNGGGEEASVLGASDYQNITTLKDTYNSLKGETTFYKYTLNGVDYYIPQSNTNDGDGSTWNTNKFTLDKSNANNPPYGYYVQDTTESVNKEAPAKVNYDSSGMMTSIVLKDGENSLSYNVSVNSVTDEDKYENDFNQYKYEMAEYEKTVEDINAQTEVIQAQDRTLELRLKQLDTEQEALTQEMDAIKKVIDKNVETTFKTFA